MKKLMFAAAVAATGMTFAASYEAQVYDVCLSIKTTEAASANLSNKDNAYLENADKEYVVYRKQASKTWKGLIWGCDCEAIDGVWEPVNAIGETGISSVKGCVIWDTKTKKPVYFGKGSNLGDSSSVPGTGFGWDFIQAIEKNGQKCEGAWTMEQDGDICEDTEWEEKGAELFNFKGAGFGTLCVYTEKDDDGYRTPLCTTYVKSISGNFAGYMKAPYKTKDTDWSGCTFCGYQPIAGSCDPADAWEYCTCKDFADIEKTAAYGTWSVKYNGSLSKKLSKTPAVKQGEIQDFIVSIRQVYNFPEAVAAGILAVELQIWDVDPTGCDELATALALAKKNTYAKELALDAVQYENLKKAEIAAVADVATAEAAKKAADTAYEYASEAYTIAKGKYETALYNQTNVNATIIYANYQGTEFTDYAVGCAAITEDIAKREGYTLVVMETSIPGLLGVRKSYTWAECKAVVAEYETATVNAKADLVKAEQNKDEKYAAQATAAVNLVKAQDALTAAQNNLANIQVLQWKATQDLAEAEAKEAVAQKAFDDAGCED